MTDLSSSVRCLGLAAAISNTSPPPVLLHMGNVIERTQIGTQCVCVCVCKARVFECNGDAKSRSPLKQEAQADFYIGGISWL